MEGKTHVTSYGLRVKKQKLFRVQRQGKLRVTSFGLKGKNSCELLNKKFRVAISKTRIFADYEFKGKEVTCQRVTCCGLRVQRFWKTRIKSVKDVKSQLLVSRPGFRMFVFIHNA